MRKFTRLTPAIMVMALLAACTPAAAPSPTAPPPSATLALPVATATSPAPTRPTTGGAPGTPEQAAGAAAGVNAAGDYIVLAWNDLGMHCYNRDFQDLAVLPPYTRCGLKSCEWAIRPRSSPPASRSRMSLRTIPTR